jgi:hypothetical protein
MQRRGPAPLPAFFVLAREFSPPSNSAPDLLSGALFCGRAQIRRRQNEPGRAGEGSAPRRYHSGCLRSVADRGAAQLRHPTGLPHGLAASQPLKPATLSQPPRKSLRLCQGVRRDISVGGHVVRRRNPCPDPDCHVADNEERRRGLKPRTGRNRLTTERGSNPLSRFHNRRLGMRGCRKQDCEDADDGRAYRIDG